MRIRITLALGLFASIAGCIFAQTGPTASSTAGQYSFTASFQPVRFPIPVVTGAPYSAVQVTEYTQTLADGSHIGQTPFPVTRVYRDSAGRTRTERPQFMIPQAQASAPAPIIVEIQDPVAGFRYILDTANRIAHRSVVSSVPQGDLPRAFREGSGAVPMPPGAADGTRPQFTRESLGSRVVEGVPADGTRITITYPVGSMMGNDRPFVRTSESWRSPDLQLVVLSKSYDLRSGEHITRLTNISRAEPDPGLFQVPADYQVVDETGPFTIQVNRP